MVALNSIVLATGGGIVIEEENRELLASRGTVFYLHTPLNTQVEAKTSSRLKEIKNMFLNQLKLIDETIKVDIS